MTLQQLPILAQQPTLVLPTILLQTTILIQPSTQAQQILRPTVQEVHGNRQIILQKVLQFHGQLVPHQEFITKAAHKHKLQKFQRKVRLFYQLKEATVQHQVPKVLILPPNRLVITQKHLPYKVV